jgi:hypothetical protein
VGTVPFIEAQETVFVFEGDINSVDDDADAGELRMATHDELEQSRARKLFWKKRMEARSSQLHARSSKLDGNETASEVAAETDQPTEPTTRKEAAQDRTQTLTRPLINNYNFQFLAPRGYGYDFPA